jgi:hypothetical protein
MVDYNKIYYNFIVGQIKDLRYAYSDLKSALLSTWIFQYPDKGLDKIEFEHAFEWAVADVFGGGCEFEIV